MDASETMEGNDERIGVRNKEFGARGEQAVCRYFEFKGYEIIETNWTCPAGEADIIAWDEDCIVFCEVKTRSSLDKGFPSEAVTKKKRKKYEKIAAWYLKEHDVFDVQLRFDVVELLVVAPDRAMVKHFVNAFGVC